MNLKKTFKKVLSLLIVAVMLISVASPVISATSYIEHLHKDAADDSKLHYVSLGASNTNGYGHHGYLDPEIYEDPLAAPKANMNDYGYDKSPENAYPALVRDALALSTGREVELHQLAISSMRVEEVLWLLDDSFVPDEYMDWRFTGGKSWFDMAHKEGGRDALRLEYREYITNADVITVDLGWNNFGVYAFNNIMTILKDNRYWKAPDFEKVVEAGMEEEYYAIRDKVIKRINETVDISDTALDGKVEMLADVLAYASFGACFNFDKVIAKIYELNPDATVVVINIQNLADELIVNLAGQELPLGDIYGEMIELVDLYRATMSPYCDKYGFAYAGVDGDVDTFLDEFRLWDGDPATLSQDMKDLFDMYDDNLYVRSKIEYIMIGQALSQVFKTLRDMGGMYGIDVFKNDSQYVYEFAFDMSWLDGVDLAALDFNNPDTPLEEYGAALSKHLVNLRNYENGGRNAYDYVFANLTEALSRQKAQLAIQADVINSEIPMLYEFISTKEALITDWQTKLETETDPVIIEMYNTEIGKAQEDIVEYEGEIAYYESMVSEIEAGIAQLDSAIYGVIPTAKQGFDNAYAGIYMAYNNTLNYAYDTVGTIIQYTLQFNTFYMTPDSMANHNSKTNKLLGYVVDTFTNNTMLKFYEELGKIGLDSSGMVAPEITVNEELFKDLGIQAACALEVRYDFGNSFFAHPSVKGNQQIKDAVMDVLNNGSHADVFADAKVDEYIGMIEGTLNSYYEDKYNELKQNGTIDGAIEGLDNLDGAMDSLKGSIEDYVIPEDIEIGTERAENIKDLLIEEIDNIKGTTEEIRVLLGTEKIEFNSENYEKLVRLARNLEKHAATLYELSAELEIVADIYLEKLEEVIDVQKALADEMAEGAYEYLENKVDGFKNEYLEFVNMVGSYVDNIDLALGEAVRNYLIEAPRDAIKIISQYGEEAITKLMVDAMSAGGELFASVGVIISILAEHGEEIFAEIEADEDYKALLEAIKQKDADLMQLYNEAKESPIVTAIDIDLRIAEEVAEIKELYIQLVDLVIKNAEAYDEEVAELLMDAAYDFVGELSILTNAGEEYLAWLGDHSKAMLGELLYTFLENTVALGEVADVVIIRELGNLKDAVVEFVKTKIEYLKEIEPELRNTLFVELGKALRELNNFVLSTIRAEYTPDKDSYYVAITGKDSAYAKLLAAALGLSDKHAVMGWDNLDKDILDKADFITIGYDRTQVSGFAVDQLLATLAAYGDDALREQVIQYFSEVLADDMSEEALAEFIASLNKGFDEALARPEFAGKTVSDMDWAELVGEENVEFIDLILADVADRLAEEGITGDVVVSVNVVDLLSEYMYGDGISIELFNNKPVFELTVPAFDIAMMAVESYIYSNIAFQLEYAETIVDLAEAHPDTKIAVLGQFNPFNDITVMGIEIPLAEIYDKVVILSNIHSYAYAMTLPNVIYVDISDAETTWNGIEDPMALLEAYLTSPTGEKFTDESNLYIMYQILGAYGLTCQHEYDGCEDEICNICGEARDNAKHDYKSVVTKPTCTEGGYTTYTCSACGHSYVDNKTEATEHKYDNACDAECNVCHEKRTPAEHVFGDWIVVLEPTLEAEGSEERVCSVCGEKETRPIEKLPAPEPEPEPEVVVEQEFGAAEIAAVITGSAVITLGLIAAVYAFILKMKKMR